MWSFYRQFKDYFNITKGESVAILLLLFISLIVGAWPYYYPEESKQDFSKLLALVDSIKKNKVTDTFTSAANYTQEFNPNSAGLSQLITIGFEKKIAYRIIGFRTKVKLFRYKEDLLKIYGIDTLLVFKLYNRIQLPHEPSQNVSKAETSVKKNEKFQTPIIEINSADSTQLESLPCIGSKLAKRLLIFRNKLGGFYKIQQLEEVYGIDTNCLENIYKKISINVNLIIKLKINKLEAKQLSAHPYIGRFLANAIVAYRQQHGNFTEPKELLKIKILDEQKLEKLLPYLDFQL